MLIQNILFISIIYIIIWIERKKLNKHSFIYKILYDISNNIKYIIPQKMEKIKRHISWF